MMDTITLIYKWSDLYPNQAYPHDNGFIVGKKYMYFDWVVGGRCRPLYIAKGMGSPHDKIVSIERI